ncbi:MAG: ATP-binding protein [Cytophagales bacterium]|nr:ATP-binding protein [Cytophagales bacterium]
MKQLAFQALLVSFFLAHSFFCNSQNFAVGELTHSDSVLFMQIENETDPAKLHDLVTQLIFLSDDKSAIPLLEEAKLVLAIAQKKKDIFTECVAMALSGQGYRLTGNFARALQYHYKAIELSKRQTDQSLIAFAINQSAHIYKDREEYQKAIALYREAMSYSERGSRAIFKLYPVMNLGFVYLNDNKPDSALYFTSRAVQMIEDIVNSSDPDTQVILQRSLYPYCLSNLAGAYSILNDKANADSSYKRAIARIQKYPNSKSRYFYFTYFSLARHYQRYHLIDSSLYAAKKAIKSVQGGAVEYLAANPAKMLSDYYENKNADSTIKYLKIFMRGNDVMNSTRVTQQLQSISFEEEQRKIEIQRAEKEFQDKVTFYSLMGGLGLLLLIAGFIYRTSLARKRTNSQLQEKNIQIEKTLNELKSTQSQLIQSEKMASLGELTAGIAHEIQNPLNFVNNFSEVNKELINEMRTEIEAGHFEDAKSIAKDIADNEDKIVFHGKRADGIVKSMLQHSRSSSGKKEPTNINALADEYLRLAYHGLRAKDKTFNAAMKTDFDETVGSVDIIAQDMGRVILNLITNAFYAVTEKKQQSAGEGYEPTVTVSTKRKPASGAGRDVVEIRVTDNGNGIPKSILDKIYQPFFTTKPTGRGTGLGLSMSYDIVTNAHGGQLKVETQPGVGTSFIIILTE